MRSRVNQMVVALAILLTACEPDPTSPTPFLEPPAAAQQHAPTDLDLVSGPHTIRRTTGAPRVDLVPISTDGFEAPFVIVLENGADDPATRATSATVTLNGELLWGPRDFKRSVSTLSAEVSLEDGATLAVRVAGKPGSFLTISIYGVALPALPPIAFSAFRGGPSLLYAINPDGTGETRVSVGTGPDFQPSWSPDGTRLVFYSERDGGDRELYELEVATGTERRLTTRPGRDVSPSYSPDGEWIVWDRDFDIYLMSADGSSGPIPLVDDGNHDVGPSFSPDGSQVIFQRQSGSVSRHYLVDVATGAVRRVTESPLTINSRASWTADGSQVYTAAQPTPGGNFHIWRVDVATGAPTQITDDPAWDLNPELSPDESALLFTSRRAGGNHLFLLDFATGAVSQLTSDPFARNGEPSWRR